MRVNGAALELTIVAAAVCAAGAAFAWWFRQRRAALGLVLLLWLTLGLGVFGQGSPMPLPARIDWAAVAGSWLPWNLLLLAVLPGSTGRSIAAGWVALLAAQYAAAAWPGLDPAAINHGLVAAAPALLRPWLEPLEPLLVAGAAVVFFARWQRRSDAGELALCLTASLLLLAVVRPEWTAGAVFGSAGLLLGGVVYASHRMAFIDPLTGLANRRALEAALVNPGRRFALAMLDIDHFKRINDRHGHDFGDQVLRMVAARIRRHRRCRPFRYGGEEFCLLFRTADQALAKAWCEQIRTEVGGTPIVPRGPQRPVRRPLSKRKYRSAAPRLTVTVSIGLAVFGGRLDQVEAVLEAADKALYRAKRNGRDRVAVARG